MARTFMIMSEPSDDKYNTFTQDVNAKLDYTVDFAPVTNSSTTDPDATDYLEDGETISSAVVVASAINGGSVVTISGSALTSGSKAVNFWVQGGDLYKDNLITTTIVTSNSRTDERSLKIILKNL